MTITILPCFNVLPDQTLFIFKTGQSTLELYFQDTLKLGLVFPTHFLGSAQCWHNLTYVNYTWFILIQDHSLRTFEDPILIYPDSEVSEVPL